MISKTIGFRGTLFSDTPIYLKDPVGSTQLEDWNDSRRYDLRTALRRGGRGFPLQVRVAHAMGDLNEVGWSQPITICLCLEGNKMGDTHNLSDSST